MIAPSVLNWIMAIALCIWAARRIEDGYTVYDEATGGYKEYTAEEMVKALLAGLPLDRYSAFYSETE